MRQKIENHMLIMCDDVDLTTLSHLELYMTQDNLFFQYTPTVKSAHELLVTVPVGDAERLKKTSVRIQLAFTDASGTPNASCIAVVPVDELLKESCYDPS
jgi:hypothetical protein